MIRLMSSGSERTEHIDRTAVEQEVGRQKNEDCELVKAARSVFGEVGESRLKLSFSRVSSLGQAQVDGGHEVDSDMATGTSQWQTPQTLIPGLPTELARCCLSRIPWICQPKLMSVCKTWAEYILSGNNCSVRSQEGVMDSLLLVVSAPVQLGSLRLNVFDARQVPRLEWKNPLAVFDFPGKWSGFMRGFRCAVVGSDFFIMGGRNNGLFHCTSDTVRRFNFKTKKWTEAAHMLVARRDFACAVVNGMVYVAGGTDSVRVLPQGQGIASALDSAEMYDYRRDEWIHLPPLSRARVGCIGVALDGRFYVIGGGTDHGTVDFELFRSAEVFDTEKWCWETIDNMWQSPAKLPRAVAGFQDSMFAVDSNEQTLKQYDEVSNHWFNVMSMPHSNTVLPGRGGHAERQQALGGIPGDQLVDLPREGLFWMGPCSLLTKSSAQNLLKLQASRSGTLRLRKGNSDVNDDHTELGRRQNIGALHSQSPTRSEKFRYLIIGSGIVHV